MKPASAALFFSFFLLPALEANAAGSMLRIVCDGDAIGAEVLIDGKFKGECPVDISIPEGKYKLRVVREVGASHEAVFEQEVRVADSTVKKVEAVLTTRLSAAAQALEDQRLKQERAEAEKRAVEKKLAHNAALTALRQQGIEPGNGKSFRDCADCPEMVLIPPGSFEMGSTGGYTDQQPLHWVSIAQAFALGKTEVTQAEWQAVMGANPSGFKNCGDNCPVENVSWHDAQEFIGKLNAKTGRQYRLPTEAEWEYACNNGNWTKYCGSDDVDAVAWYNDNSGRGLFSDGHPHPVGQKQPNAFGLYDMSGNISEFTADRYHDNYNGAPTDGSEWPGNGVYCVIRGGSWGDVSENARAVRRAQGGPDNVYDGFRLARTLP